MNAPHLSSFLRARAVGSAEGLAVAFESFLQNRVVEIMQAAHGVERAQQAVDTADRSATGRTRLLRT
jgi:hypothetical protein